MSKNKIVSSESNNEGESMSISRREAYNKNKATTVMEVDN
jgi:hypothetical protein